MSREFSSIATLGQIGINNCYNYYYDSHTTQLRTIEGVSAFILLLLLLLLLHLL